MLTNSVYRFLLLTAALLLSVTTSAQEDLSNHWDGLWQVEGTLFSIAVTAVDGRLLIEKRESLGFVWSSRDGRVDGNIAIVTVEYAGVTGTVQAELIDPNTAVAFAATCLPDFMVVCLLAKDRQAVFRKMSGN